MRFLINVLVWLVLGLVAGFAISFIFFMPAPPEPFVIQPSPPGNATQPSPALSNSVSLAVISIPECEECNYHLLVLGSLTEAAPGFNITIASITQYEKDSSEAAALISEYDLKVLPSIIITGEPTDPLVSAWTAGLGTQEQDGALVMRSSFPPYYDVENATVLGLVKATAIAPLDCTECLDPALYFEALENPAIDVIFSEKQVLYENETAARDLIIRYNITKLPTIVLSSDIMVYPTFASHFSSLGSVDGEHFILRDVNPPYIDLEDNRSIRGFVEAVYIINSSCEDCFDPQALSVLISQSLGLYLTNETVYEANSTEAAVLVASYNITRIPTILYSPESSVYPSFDEFWDEFGSSKHEDGWYVFRSYEEMELTYQNLTID